MDTSPQHPLGAGSANLNEPALLPPTWARYGMAVAAVGVSLFVRLAFDPLWGPTSLPFTLFLPAVVITAWYGRVGPALVSIGLSSAAAVTFFLAPGRPSAGWQPGEIVAVISFFAVGLLITAALEAMHRANARSLIELGERRRSEAALRASEAAERARSAQLESTIEADKRKTELVEAIVNRIPVMIAMLEPDRNIVQLNPELRRITGWPATESSRRDLLAQLCPERAYREQVRTFLTTCDESWRDFRLRARDGRKVDSYWASIRLSNGTCLCIGIDITARKQMEEALRESEEVFAKAFRACPDGLIISRTSDGVIQEVNERSLRLFGLERSETVGHSTAELGLYADPAEYSVAMKRLAAEGRVRDFEIRIQAAGDEIRTTALSIESIEVHGQPCLLTIVRDITDQKHAAAELQASSERMRLVVNATGVSLFQQDADLRYVWVHNPLSGYGAAALVGRTDEELPHPINDVAAFVRAKREVLATARGARIEVVNHGADGVRSYHDVTLEPLCDAEGRAVGLLGASVDVTRHKEADVRLRDREEQLRFVTDHAEVMIVQCDAKGRYTFANTPFAARYGLRSDQVVGRHMSEVLGMEGYECLRPYLETALRGQRVEFEIQVPYRTIEPRWTNCVWVPQPGPGGEVAGFVAVIQDITARKKAEQALRESEELFRAMADGLPLLVWLHDAEGQQTFVNRTFCEFFRVSLEQMKGGEWQLLLHPEDAEAYTGEFLASVAARRSFHAETRARHGDGSWRWMESWAWPRTSDRGEFLGMVGASVDITERKENEVALRTSEAEARARAEELAAIMEAVPAITFLAHDPACREMSSNRAARELLRLTETGSASDLPPEAHPRVSFRSTKEGRELAREEMPVQRAAATGREVRGYELTVQFDDGSAREILGNAVPLFDVAGRVRGAVGAFVDITDRKRAEQQLEAARDDALAASRAKDDFIALLSHELRTPLSPVLLIATEAVNDPTLPEPVQADFQTIAQNVALEARLIDDLLDLNRITRGKVVLEREPLDVHAVLRDAVQGVEEDAAAKQIAISFELEPEAATVLGDPVRLRQVFWNVLKNAVKFTPVGGHIEVGSKRPPASGDVEVNIRDSGIGMTADELVRAFEPFAQGEHARETTTRYGGLGLGLTIARTLVERHDGRVYAESGGPGHGTNVFIRLPVMRQAESAVAPPPAESAPPAGAPGALATGTGPRSVLLVEDHAATRRALTLMLQRRGLQVTAAASLAEARAHAETNRFDLLISDLGLPDGDGCVLMAELRSKGATLPGVAITGYGMEADFARSRAAGFSQHLTKPITVSALERSLKKLLGESGARI